MKFYRIHSSENISICHKAKIIICDLNAYTYKIILIFTQTRKLALTLKTDTTDNKRAENDRQNANASQN